MDETHGSDEQTGEPAATWGPLPPRPDTPPPGPSAVAPQAGPEWAGPEWPAEGAGAAGWPPPSVPAGSGWGPPSRPDPYWTPQPPRRGSISVAVTAVLVVVAALAGIGIGRSLPASARAASTSPTTAPSRGRPSSPAPLLPGVGSGGGANSGGASSQTGAGGPADASAIAARVDPGLVDIDTDLSYEAAEAAGTGIVLSSDGLVLTNNHVINGSTSITVRDIGNGHSYDATVVGYDESSDIALIQLSGASSLTTDSIGDSSSVKVGTAIVAIGNAGGKNGTPAVAPGSVTALNQSITASDEGDASSEQLSGLIQTNANVQPGDSGGSLVTADGVIIGIDTAAAENSAASDAAQGFAIPINTAITLAHQIEAGRASSSVHIGATAFLGVEFDAQAEESDVASVSKVVPDTAASKVGLVAGDIITSLGGRMVSAPSSLTAILVKYHPGQQVPVTWTTSAGADEHATLTLGTGPAA